MQCPLLALHLQYVLFYTAHFRKYRRHAFRNATHQHSIMAIPNITYTSIHIIPSSTTFVSHSVSLQLCLSEGEFCGHMQTGPKRDVLLHSGHPAGLIKSCSLLSTRDMFPLGLQASPPPILQETIHKTLKCLACQISTQQANRGFYGPN